jgi:hypothetical protein
MIPRERPDLRELAIRVRANAVAHGWHTPPRPLCDAIVLIHAEVSEAVEAYRDRLLEAWDEDGKPCGVWSELADVIIRLLDLHGHGPYLDWLPRAPRCQLSPARDLMSLAFGLHGDLDGVGFGPRALERVVDAIETFSAARGVDIWAEVERKHVHNTTRPYRHGGKHA